MPTLTQFNGQPTASFLREKFRLVTHDLRLDHRRPKWYRYSYRMFHAGFWKTFSPRTRASTTALHNGFSLGLWQYNFFGIFVIAEPEKYRMP